MTQSVNFEQENNTRPRGNPAWQKGMDSPNPGGKPAGFRPINLQIQEWLDKGFDYVADLYADKNRLKKLSTNDVIIVTRIANTLTREGGQDVERLWNRAYGTPEAMTKVAMLVADITEKVADKTQARALVEGEANQMLDALAVRTAGLIPSSKPLLLHSNPATDPEAQTDLT